MPALRENVHEPARVGLQGLKAAAVLQVREAKEKQHSSGPGTIRRRELPCVLLRVGGGEWSAAAPPAQRMKKTIAEKRALVVIILWGEREAFWARPVTERIFSS